MRSSTVALGVIGALAIWGFAAGWSAVREQSAYPVTTIDPPTRVAARGERVVFNGLAWFGPLPSAPPPVSPPPAAARSSARPVTPVAVDQQVELAPALDAPSAATDAVAREEIPPPAFVPPLIDTPPPTAAASEPGAP